LNLTLFLDKKGAEYAPFDVKRFRLFYEKHIDKFQNLPKIVQIVGTNGKGTTGRFLAQILKNSALKVGHFTSPHILSFTERFWLDGDDISLDELENAHQQLLSSFGDELNALSYFEYLTLLCLPVFSAKVDVLVLEAGLGGEFDSTSTLPKELLLVTNIGLDHQEMLGKTIEEITLTKLRAAANTPVIVGIQSSEGVYEVIKKEFDGKNISFVEGIKPEVSEFASKSGFAAYLQANLALAIAAAEFFGIIKPKLENIPVLKGRFERIAPNITVDVGHNALAAQMIKKELDGKKVTLIFNCYADKDPMSVLSILKESVKKVEIIDISGERVIGKEELIKILDRIGFLYGDFTETKEDEEYLVFGSFSVVCEFLRRLS
jgi:dihydrofolate synthase / folylpolyglutamate synthase